MPYLYTPPQWQSHAVMEGALRYRIASSTTVYRLGGTWFNVQSPSYSNPDPALCDVEAGVLLYFNTPVVVPDALHAELAAVLPASSTWSAGTLTPA